MKALVDRRAHLHQMVIIALGLGLRKREQLNLRCDHIDFFGNVVIASKTKGKRNREVPLDVLDERVKPILRALCGTKKADEFSSTQQRRSPTWISSDRLPLLVRMRKFAIGVARSEGDILYSVGVSGLRRFYDQGAHGAPRDEDHREVYSANRLTREVEIVQSVHKLAKNEIRPPVLAAVFC